MIFNFEISISSGTLKPQISLLRRYIKYYYRFKDSIVVSDVYAANPVSYSVEIDVQEMLQHILFHLC